MDEKKQIEEKHELSESIYMSGHGLDRKDSADIAEQLYHEGYRKQSVGGWEFATNHSFNDYGDLKVYATASCSECENAYPCYFCGQIFDTEDEKLHEFNNPVYVEKDGYTATQSSNNHVHVTDSKGRLIYHASFTRKMSRKELQETIDFVKGIKEGRGDLSGESNT